jgi:hypothetical protein
VTAIVPVSGKKARSVNGKKESAMGLGLAIPLSKIWTRGGASRTKTCSDSFVFRTEHVPEMDTFVAQPHSEDCAADAQECTKAMNTNKVLTENGLEGEKFKTKNEVEMRQI